MVAGSLAEIGFILIVIGFALAFVAAILLAAKNRGDSSRTRGGGVLLIGPIPIIFGTDKEGIKVLVLLAIILMIIVLALMFMPVLVMR